MTCDDSEEDFGWHKRAFSGQPALKHVFPRAITSFFFCFPRGEQVREKESNTDDELYDELHSMGNMRMIQQQQQQQYRSSI
jgi:hypothetical protein